MNNQVGQIQDFLGVSIPESVIESNIEIIETLENSRVKEILPEREPQLYVKKAVFLNMAGKNIVLATVPVTEKMCRGHFEWFPMMPLALLGQATAQAGSILVSLIGGEENTIPLTVCVREIRSISGRKGEKRKDFIVPDDTLLIVATYLEGKLGFHTTSGDIYVNSVKMCVMREIIYILVDRSRIIRGDSHDG